MLYDRGKKQICVLAVDDEEINLDILEEYLSDANYFVLTAQDSDQALEVLRTNPDQIDIILLDRMMPGTDGLELLKILKSYPEYEHIPVIMQTAAAATNQVIEGIQAGAFYYLTKPYEKQTLLALVASAARAVEDYQYFKDETYNNLLMLDCMEASHYKLQTIEQGRRLCLYLGKMCPKTRDANYGFSELSCGFSELITNAIEHGNLGIGYDLKGELLNEGKPTWLNEVARRQALPENKVKFVEVDYRKTKEAITVSVKDQGQGFNWEKFLEIDPLRCTDNHGRGIALANSIFDELEYQENGSLAVATIKLAE